MEWIEVWNLHEFRTMLNYIGAELTNRFIIDAESSNFVFIPKILQIRI